MRRWLFLNNRNSDCIFHKFRKEHIYLNLLFYFVLEKFALYYIYICVCKIKAAQLYGDEETVAISLCEYMKLYDVAYICKESLEENTIRRKSNCIRVTQISLTLKSSHYYFLESFITNATIRGINHGFILEI